MSTAATLSLNAANSSAGKNHKVNPINLVSFKVFLSSNRESRHCEEKKTSHYALTITWKNVYGKAISSFRRSKNHVSDSKCHCGTNSTQTCIVIWSKEHCDMKNNLQIASKIVTKHLPTFRNCDCMNFCGRLDLFFPRQVNWIRIHKFTQSLQRLDWSRSGRFFRDSVAELSGAWILNRNQLCLCLNFWWHEV